MSPELGRNRGESIIPMRTSRRTANANRKTQAEIGMRRIGGIRDLWMGVGADARSGWERVRFC